MAEIHCPGQDLRYWKLDDIYELDCVHCGARIEFFKDDPRRLCKACGKRMLNPPTICHARNGASSRKNVWPAWAPIRRSMIRVAL